jgi:hypothetical protein
MSNIKFEVHGTKNFSEKERQKFSLALKKAEEVMNSQEFKELVLLYPFDQANGYTNQEIYDMIMSGADKFNTMSDGDIDVQITLYYSWKRTIGYTYPSTWATWVNRRFFSKFDSGEIAGNVVHEYMHNMGFGHRTAKDHDSVPYAVGYLVRDLINKKEIDMPEPSEQAPTRRKRRRWYLPWTWFRF